jgi:hypothetical protein
MSLSEAHVLMHSGTPMLDMVFTDPSSALFFNHDPNKLIVACSDHIYLLDVSTQSTQSLGSTPLGSWNWPHSIALCDDDAVLVAGNGSKPHSICGYDMKSLTRMWIHTPVSHVGSVCMLGAHVLVSVLYNPTLMLDCKTGAQIVSLKNAEWDIRVLGVVEGLCFFVCRLRCGNGLRSIVCSCDWLL